MSAEAQTKHCFGEHHFNAPAAYSAGQVIQLADGQAAVVPGMGAAIALADPVAPMTVGAYSLPKAASIVMLAGQRAFWDAANNQVSYTGDFEIGVVEVDAAASDTRVLVKLNEIQRPDVAFGKGLWTTAAALGLGATYDPLSNKVTLAFDAVAEIAMAAVYGPSVPLSASPILECYAAVHDIGDAAALDISLGMANATHATDFDAVTEAAIIHSDGSSLNILAESDDGTTEVAAADTTVDWVDDVEKFVQIDARDLTDVKFYINGVRVLSGTTFKLDAATGPMIPIAHIEKTSDDTTADLRVRDMVLRAGGLRT